MHLRTRDLRAPIQLCDERDRDFAAVLVVCGHEREGALSVIYTRERHDQEGDRCDGGSHGKMDANESERRALVIFIMRTRLSLAFGEGCCSQRLLE